MSNSNEGSGNGTRKALSHAQFYLACEAMKKHRQEFLDKRPNGSQTAALLASLCGFAVSTYAAAEVKAATGILWEPRRAMPKSRAEADMIRRHQIRTLTVALCRLYRKLDEELPSSLEALYGHVYREASPASAPLGALDDREE